MEEDVRYCLGVNRFRKDNYYVCLTDLDHFNHPCPWASEDYIAYRDLDGEIKPLYRLCDFMSGEELAREIEDNLSA